MIPHWHSKVPADLSLKIVLKDLIGFTKANPDSIFTMIFLGTGYELTSSISVVTHVLDTRDTMMSSLKMMSSLGHANRKS
jgi:hypothetical protein